MKNVCIIGSGPFGGAMATLFQHASSQTQISCIDLSIEIAQRNLEPITILDSESISFYSKQETPEQYGEVIRHADLIVIAVGSKYFLTVADEVQTFRESPVVVMNVSKGLASSGNTFSQEIEAGSYDMIQYACLGGGMAACDVYAGRTTGATIGCQDLTTAEVLATLLRSSLLEVETISDVLGVEYSGVLKNLVSIQAGFVAHEAGGIELGKTAIDAVVSTSTQDIYEYASQLDVQSETFTQTYCRDHPEYGDIKTSCYGRTRNLRLGMKWQEIGSLSEAVQMFEKEHITVEGANTLKLLQTTDSPLSSLPFVEELLISYRNA